MALLQVQAALVSFVAAMLSFALGFVIPRSQSSSAASESTSDASIFIRRPRPKIPNNPSGIHSGALEYVMHALSMFKIFLTFQRFVMVATTGILSAALSSLILGSFMCSLVIFCRKFRLNPGVYDHC